jgi:hypothetical protein
MPCLGKTFVVDQRSGSGMLEPDGVLVNHPAMHRTMKPKQQHREGLLSCGRVQKSSHDDSRYEVIRTRENRPTMEQDSHKIQFQDI